MILTSYMKVFLDKGGDAFRDYDLRGTFSGKWIKFHPDYGNISRTSLVPGLKKI